MKPENYKYNLCYSFFLLLLFLYKNNDYSHWTQKYI